MKDIIQAVGPYVGVLKLAIEIIILYVLYLICRDLFRKWKEEDRERKKYENRTRLTAEDLEGLSRNEIRSVVKSVIAPDGIDASPNTYMLISDGGREVYVRHLTLSKLPKKMIYAETMNNLFDFPNCTCTTFVDPIANEVIGRKIDRQINQLEAEEISSAGNTNRVRKLGSQIEEVTAWADRLETGDKKFFNVGFLFTFIADSVDELNRLTDNFRAKARNQKMEVSNCYAVQGEAFLSSLPFNRRYRAEIGKVGVDGVEMHLMDEGAVSVVMNYTTDSFTHKQGAPIGRNLFNDMPFIFDLFDPSHFGFCMVICGKTGSGKSTLIKVLIERSIPRNVRYVCIDSQGRKGLGEGEYSSVTELNCGVNYQISSSLNNILNIFDVQESIEFVKTSVSSGFERRTLDLNSAISDMVINIRSMMQIGEEGPALDAVTDSDVDEIITKTIKELFSERGIYHGDADSLYVSTDNEGEGTLGSGMVMKELPTLTQFYVRILEFATANGDEKISQALRLIINNMKEYVRELYYSEQSVTVFTREEYLKLPFIDDRSGTRVYEHGNMRERVVELHGIRPYFDGQSTFAINRNCPITNIDISQLTDNERKVAREIAIRFVNEQFVKKNSESLSSADHLVVIVDEAHESFAGNGRKTLENIVRTCRKRNTGIIFATQTVREFDKYTETQNILKQAAVKIVFKQDTIDAEYLQQALNITKSQSAFITKGIGSVDRSDNDSYSRERRLEEKNRKKHQGECCVVDGDQVMFLRVDYLKSTEGLAVETDAASVVRALSQQ